MKRMAEGAPRGYIKNVDLTRKVIDIALDSLKTPKKYYVKKQNIYLFVFSYIKASWWDREQLKVFEEINTKKLYLCIIEDFLFFF